MKQFLWKEVTFPNTLTLAEIAALFKTKNGETLTLQMILGDSLPVSHGFYATIRIGANATTNKRANALLLSLMSALRILENTDTNLLFCNT